LCQTIYFEIYVPILEASWNVIAHAQKPDFVFRRNGRVNRRGASVQSTTGSRGVRISGSNDGYNMFRGGVKGAGYPLYSPVSPSLPLPCVTVCRHISTGVYYLTTRRACLPWKKKSLTDFGIFSYRLQGENTVNTKNILITHGYICS